MFLQTQLSEAEHARKCEASGLRDGRRHGVPKDLGVDFV
jgi:hypothetical protein